MTKFIYAWWHDTSENTDTLIISTKEYFETTNYMNDSYSDEEYLYLDSFFHPLGIEEMSESIYEISTDKETVTAALELNENFEFSEKFQEFVL